MRNRFVAATLFFPVLALAQTSTGKPTTLPQKTVAESLGLAKEKAKTDIAPSEVKKPLEANAPEAAPVADTPKYNPGPKGAKGKSVGKTKAKSKTSSNAESADEAAVLAPPPALPATSVSKTNPDGTTETRLLVTTSALSAETEPTDAAHRNEVIKDVRAADVKTEMKVEKVEEVKPATYHHAFDPEYINGRPRFSLGFGYVHSQWKKFSGALKNGSLEMRVAASREWTSGFESEIGLSALFLNSQSSGENSNGTFTVDLGGRWMPWKHSHFRPFAGLHASFGSYRVWSVLAESPQLVTYEKHGSGTLFGLVPSLGMRLEASPHLSFDVEANYRGYFDNPAWKTGGWGALVRLGFAH